MWIKLVIIHILPNFSISIDSYISSNKYINFSALCFLVLFSLQVNTVLLLSNPLDTLNTLSLSYRGTGIHDSIFYL